MKDPILASRFPAVVGRIAQAVADAGGTAFLVGGAVRDSLLGAPSVDFDLEVYRMLPPTLNRVMKALDPSWMDTVGASFGVLKAQFGEHLVDVSLAGGDPDPGTEQGRVEVKGDPPMPFREAARRRDFTINAMAIDPLSGQIFDYFEGQRDLQRKVLRATDAQRFGDDPLRVLRAAQFAARLEFSIEPRTIELCRAITLTPEFAELPADRIGPEWRKLLLMSRSPSMGMRAGLQIRAWSVLHPELQSLVGCQQDMDWHPEGDVWTHTNMVIDAAAEIVRREQMTKADEISIMLGALCHDFGKPSTTEFIEGRWRSRGHEAAGLVPTHSFLSRIGLAKGMHVKIERLVADHLFPSIHAGTATDAAVRRLAKRLQPATIEELILVSEADQRGRALPWKGFPAGEALVAQASRLSVQANAPRPIISGQDLIDNLGLVPGKPFGRILSGVEEAQIAGAVTTFEEGLAMARLIATQADL
jgi:tRNA nucleotidyltransferase (CCA-adding enzyme)